MICCPSRWIGYEVYAAVSACEAVIRSIERGVLDREMREHITKLRGQISLWIRATPSTFRTCAVGGWGRLCGIPRYPFERSRKIFLIPKNLGRKRCQLIHSTPYLCNAR
ncbi:MAG: hypothetical protein CM15mP77_1020 [Synechococcus sp.]|nr:MAG: hypothetical protein CM15mP77_1020 [Synechococcus sp.]